VLHHLELASAIETKLAASPREHAASGTGMPEPRRLCALSAGDEEKLASTWGQPGPNFSAEGNWRSCSALT